MRKIETGIKDLYILEANVYNDKRGSFFEIYNKSKFLEIGITDKFVQDNYSKSKRGVLRGLHFQTKFSQAKLIQVLNGKILDVVVDLRKDSQTFGKYFKIELNSFEKKMLYIPKNFAHGFLVLEDNTEVLYKCDDYYKPQYESGIIWNDKDLKIDWELKKQNIKEKEIILSEKDKKLQTWEKYMMGELL